MVSRELCPRSLSGLPARVFERPKLPVTAPLVRRSSEVLMRLIEEVVSIRLLYGKGQVESCPSGQNPNWHSVSDEFNPVGGRETGCRFVIFVAGDKPFGNQGTEDAGRDVIVVEGGDFMQPAAAGVVHAFFNRGKKGGFFSGELNGHLGLVVFHVINILQNKQAMSAIVPLLNPAQ